MQHCGGEKVVLMLGILPAEITMTVVRG